VKPSDFSFLLISCLLLFGAKGDSKVSLKYLGGDKTEFDTGLSEDDFFVSIGKVLSKKVNKPVVYLRQKKSDLANAKSNEDNDLSANCESVFKSSLQNDSLPQTFCIHQRIVTKIKLAGKWLDSSGDVFVIMSQLDGALPESKAKIDKRLRHSELKKVLDRKPHSINLELFGHAIVQANGKMIDLGFKELCSRLARTHSNFAWYKGPKESQFYMTFYSMRQEPMGLLFETNKINIGTVDKPEYVKTNQLLKVMIVERNVPDDDMINQLSPLSKLPSDKTDTCPGI
jgi:hypothetical protein